MKMGRTLHQGAVTRQILHLLSKIQATILITTLNKGNRSRFRFEMIIFLLLITIKGTQLVLPPV
jgi:hypothetical protein